MKRKKMIETPKPAGMSDGDWRIVQDLVRAHRQEGWALNRSACVEIVVVHCNLLPASKVEPHISVILPAIEKFFRMRTLLMEKGWFTESERDKAFRQELAQRAIELGQMFPNMSASGGGAPAAEARAE